MVRWRSILTALVIGAVFASVSCAGGDKPRPNSDGQADYLDQVLSSWCTAGDATPDPSELATRLVQQVDRIAKLSPPGDLASAQREYVALARNAVNDLKSLDAARTVDPNSESGRTIAAAIEADRSFQKALTAHYSVTFFRVEGSSMQPAFGNGEILPFDAQQKAVRRWDLLAFKFPPDPSRTFMKRVVGLPGETIEVRDGGQIYVNGAAVDGDTYAKDPANYTYGPRTVPADSYWVLGDNRRNSFDSHAWAATCAAQQQCDFVPKDLILGVLPADAKGCKSTESS